MYKHRSLTARLASGVTAVACLTIVSLSSAQVVETPDNGEVQYHVDEPAQRMKMIVGTSRILTMDRKIARMLVNSQSILRATPLSPNQIQVSALQMGVTQLNLWDENDRIYSIDVEVNGDVRALETVLRDEFPQASLRIRALNQGVRITGYVPRGDMINQITRIAEQYYPHVQNDMMVGGVQQILLHTKVFEVSRSKLRSLGIDWAAFNGNDFFIQNVNGLISGSATAGNVTGSGAATMRFGIVGDSSAFFMFLDALRDDGLAKILAEPSLVTMSGRPARFLSGGEFPIIVPQGNGAVSVDYREFGTQVDFVPIVLGDGRIRLEVRPQISSLDAASGVSFNGTSVPGLRSRGVDTACELQAGQTFALAGLIQQTVESRRTGIPWVSDLPWIGVAFRRVEEQVNEIELMILVTPELIGPMDAHQVPPCGPGQLTTSPNDVELYFRGYIEVPNCCADGSCPQCMNARMLHGGGAGAAVISNPQSSFNPSNATMRSLNSTDAPTKRSPSIVGPVGYDVIE